MKRHLCTECETPIFASEDSLCPPCAEELAVIPPVAVACVECDRMTEWTEEHGDVCARCVREMEAA